VFDDNEGDVGLAVALSITLAIVVSLFTLSIALTAIGAYGPAARGPMAAVASLPGRPAEPPAEAVLHFAIGSAQLPGDAQAQAAAVLAALKDQPKAIAQISGFHDASGNRDANLELAKQRALAVRDLLLATGLPPERLVLEKPRETLGGADPRAARRVDVRVR
jgi:hypothetical protein